MDPNNPLPFVLRALVLPAVVTGIALLAGLRLRAARSAIAALAVGIGYAVGHVASLRAVPGFPPTDSLAALFYVALAATLVGLLRGASSVPGLPSSIVLAAVAGAAPWVLLRNLMSRWSALGVATAIAITAVGVTAFVITIDRWAERRRGVSLPLVLWMTAAIAAVSLGISGTVTYAAFSGSMAAVLGACIVFAWIARDMSYARGATVVFAIVLSCFCYAGVYLAELPRASAILLFYSPLAAVAVDRGPVERLSTFKAHAVRLLAVLLVAGAALAIAYSQSPPAEY